MSSLEKRVQDILAKAASNIINAAKANLKDGPLKKSLRAKEGKNSIEIIMEDYGMFKDKGVSGANHSDFKGKKKKIHKSVAGYKFNSSSKAIGGIEGIDKWMTKNNIRPRDSQGRYTKDRDTANYLIRRSIHHHGIKPSLFLTKPYEKYNEQIRQEFNNLAAYIIKDINNGTNRQHNKRK